MRDTAPGEALRAVERLDDRETRELLGYLCGSRPEAVLAGIQGLARHQALIRQLRSQTAPDQRLG